MALRTWNLELEVILLLGLIQLEVNLSTFLDVLLKKLLVLPFLYPAVLFSQRTPSIERNN